MSPTAGNYAVELEVATRAALEAGRVLRDEFHRPGGPRGGGGHALVDEQAESLIRQALTEAFPDYAYRGEETGFQAGSGKAPRHTWLVDPNDGTSAYLKGFRGAAVSIALLCEGQPVLGVVYAYGAPDDRGDLFAWAQGAGPLRRNGQPVSRQWPASLDPSGTVLVSHHADRNPLANAHAARPLRFRAIPGIAYRLALVAAGEGELGVSLNGPCGWDYAGGHALLRGAGGELCDGSGRPITYTPEGESHCGGACFGGAPEIVAALHSRDWASALQRPARSADPLHLCWPEPGRTVADAGVLARAHGCLLGQLAGDDLGGLVEFKGPETIAELYPEGVRLLLDGGGWRTLAGQPTDDSEMALALARSIVQAGGYDAEAAASAYAWWFSTGPYDYGNATEQALRPAIRALQTGRPVARAAREAANTATQPNGSLMRVSPIGIVCAALPPGTAAQWAREDATLTHPDPVCQDASAVFAETVAYAIRTGPEPSAAYEYALQIAAQSGVSPVIGEVLDRARDVPPTGYAGPSRGWVLVAFQNAFYQLLHAPSLEEGVVDSVMRGGDTDTNAAIAGALLGATYGRDAVPFQWLDRVLTCRPIVGLPGVVYPRPQAFWPVDALWLAELLVTAGPDTSSPND